MVFDATITGDTWMGEALIPWTYFPPNVNQMNSYAIHGSGEKRTYEALYPVPKEEIAEGQTPNLWVYITSWQQLQAHKKKTFIAI